MDPNKIAVIAVLVALATATNYAMIPFYNVKLMDIIVFIGGFLFGPLVGASIGIFSWTVYGTLNPLGFSVNIWVATMLSETVFGVVGGLIGKTSYDFRVQRAGLCLSFAVLGGILTFVYDVVTNVVWGYTYGPSILFAVVFGFVPFSLIHIISNILFFGVGCVPAISAVSNLIGGDRIGTIKK